MHDGHDPEADRKELQGEGGGPPGGTRRVVLGFADAASPAAKPAAAASAAAPTETGASVKG